MKGQWVDSVDLLVDAAWFRLVWLCKVVLILGFLAGCGYVVVEGLPFREWLRVEIVIDGGSQ